MNENDEVSGEGNAAEQPRELATQGRQVKMYMTQEGRSKTFVTNAMTWGEFQSEIDGDFRNKEVVIKEGRHSLSVDSAELPKGNFTLFVYPKQSKSGVDSDVEELGYNKGRSVANYLNRKFDAGIDISGSKENILDGIQDAIDNENLTIEEVLEDMEKNPVGRTKEKKAKPVVKAPAKKEKKASIASKLAPKKEAPKEKEVVKQMVKEEPVKEKSFPKQSINSGGNTFPGRVDVHIHINGLHELAEAMKFAASIPFAGNRDTLANQVVEKDSKEELIRLQAEEDEKKRREELEFQQQLEAEIRAKREEDERVKREIEEEKRRIEKENRDRQKRDEEELSKEARDIGRELKH